MNITKTEVEAAKLAFEQAHEAYMQTPVWAPNARKVKDTMLAKRHDYEDKLKQLALAVVNDVWPNNKPSTRDYIDG